MILIVCQISSKVSLWLNDHVAESGVQFYSGNFVSKDGARKKIHGGTGQIAQNDGYGPGSQYQIFLSIFSVIHVI